MNEIFSYLNFNDINSNIGYEISRFIDSSDETIRINCMLNSYYDLIIDSAIELQFLIPFEYRSIGGLKINIVESGNLVYFKDYLDEEKYVKIPWMNKFKSFLSVWFYAVRDILKIQLENPWTSSIHLKPEFAEYEYLSPIYSNSEQNKLSIICGDGSTKGKRNYMEDMHFIFDNIKITDKFSVALYGVLDGHGGKSFELIVNQFLKHIEKFIIFK
jgi:hypothetical protein